MDAMGLQILFTHAWSNVSDVELKLWCLSYILEDGRRVEHTLKKQA